MSDPTLRRNTAYSLAEEAILSTGLLSATTGYALVDAEIPSKCPVSTATSSDVLARRDIVTAAVEPPSPVAEEVVIQIRTPERVERMQVSGRLSRAFLASIQAIAELLRLPPGWNSYLAKPIAPQNAIHAIRLLAVFLGSETPPPLIVPTVRGGIQLEWHTNGVNIEIYINAPNSISFFAEAVESDDSFEGPLAGHEQALRLWIERISGKMSWAF